MMATFGRGDTIKTVNCAMETQHLLGPRNLVD